VGAEMSVFTVHAVDVAESRQGFLIIVCAGRPIHQAFTHLTLHALQLFLTQILHVYCHVTVCHAIVNTAVNSSHF